MTRRPVKAAVNQVMRVMGINLVVVLSMCTCVLSLHLLAFSTVLYKHCNVDLLGHDVWLHQSCSCLYLYSCVIYCQYVLNHTVLLCSHYVYFTIILYLESVSSSRLSLCVVLLVHHVVCTL